MADRPRFYITTAIPYANGAPHIGHAYERIATDAIARAKRLDGHEVLFVTGMDEHGQKMQQTAAREGLSPQALADRTARQFDEMAVLLDARADDIVRTTEDRHRVASQEIWRRMEAKGDIYRSTYAGWYSVRDEAYYGDAELVLGPDGRKLAPTGTPVEWVEEASYFFRLSAYGDRLLTHYEKNPNFVMPERYRNEVEAFVRRGLADLSISRTTFDWGIPVPNDPAHVMYVWVDALTNYLTGTGFPDAKAQRAAFWPADAHVIGKDITRFHAIFWPAFLMSADLPVPRQIVVHGFLFNRGEKMSKSTGNVVDPIALAQTYGVDQIRYFFLREVPFGQDGSYSHEAIVNRINADLANDLGNLAQRSLSMIGKNCNGVVPHRQEPGGADQAMLAAAYGLPASLRVSLRDFALHEMLADVWAVVSEANRYFAAEEPWIKRRSDPARMEGVLYVTAEVLRVVAIMLQPFMPTSMAALLDLLGVPPGEARDFAAASAEHRLQSGTPLPAPRAIFPRYVEPGRGHGARYLMLIDSHCHLDFPDFDAERAATVDRARAAGVVRLVTIATRVARHAALAAIAEQFDDVYFTVGTHPLQAAEEPDVGVETLLALAAHPKCVGIGEAGLDYHYDPVPRDLAAKVFRTQVDAARRSGLPLVIHARDADADMAAILREEMGQGPFRAVLHCFTGGRALAETGLELGLSISFSGVVTFRGSDALRSIARDVPLDRILVETDAPFLSPQPLRGKRNEPANVVHTAAVLAELKGLAPDAFGEATVRNTLNLFEKMPPLGPAA